MNRPTTRTASDGSPASGGFFNWLGRQVGFVVGAARSRSRGEETRSAPPVDEPSRPNTLWRRSSVAEKPLPGREHVILRRTTVDEVIETRRPPPTGDQ